ncbi:hypothetical protein OS493_018900 [Desmophyllum pertusum]|uniref:Uncharacterized protein n=1 Tax=Desmophyllum pertusum TaxID=174260 RepID=A0A9W9ZCR7_9CNID|nr:hypothetical protein OS493_018900 [Desmophyllum pertusum]
MMEIEVRGGTTVCFANVLEVFPTVEDFYKFKIAENIIITGVTLAITVGLYVAIGVKLLLRRLPGDQQEVNTRHSEAVARRVVRMMVCVVLVFCLCWSPNWILSTVCNFIDPRRKVCRDPNAGFVKLVVAYSNSAITPFIYPIFSENFRTSFKRILRGMFCCKRGTQVRGNEDDDTTKYVKLGYVIRARHVRVRPLSWMENMCMRIELYGCTARGLNTIGFEAGKIANSSLNASSVLNKYHKPGYARLNTVIEGGAWCARETNTSQYFQVDLIEIHKLRNVILQGKYSGPAEEQGWVTKFSVTYSNDGIMWSQQVQGGLEVFEGNNLDHKTKNHEMSPSLHTRFVRLHAVEWHQLICMRIELMGCKACAEPLGLETGKLHGDYLSGSSKGALWTSIRLNNNKPWTGATGDTQEYIQVVIKPYGKTVTALAIEGYSHLVTSFTLRTSEDATEWNDYTVNGNIEVLFGCTTQYQTSRTTLPKNISSRYIRLHPRTWVQSIHISLELYGCDECAEPLGMVSGLIPDSNIRASSFKVGGEPYRARLGYGSGWIPSSFSSSEYLEVDLGEPKVITYVEIEGDSHNAYWLHSFFLDYRMSSEESWKKYQPRGSSEAIRGLYMRDMVKKIAMDQKLEARFIKIRVKDWQRGASLKLELYGCDKVCSDEVGIGSWIIKEPAFTASSYLSSRSYPWMARLHGRESWCPGKNDTQPFLQVDIGRPYRLRFIATQGVYSGSNNSAWVQQYTLDFRGEHSSRISYAENGNTKIFTGNADGTSIVKNQLMNVTNVRYIRLHPKKWHIHACVRIELYGCKVFNELSLTPLGMSDHRIADSDILASDSHESIMHGTHGPWLARLHNGSGCWVFPKAENFLLVDLGEGLTSVGGVATQGCNNQVIVMYGYVLEYLLSFSDDGAGWYYYREGRAPIKVFSGNTYKEQDVPVRHVFIRELNTRYVKFHVTRWLTDLYLPALRVEIYGHRTGENLNVDLIYHRTAQKANLMQIVKELREGSPGARFSKGRGSSHGRVAFGCEHFLQCVKLPISADTTGQHTSGNKTWCAEFDDDMQYLEIDLKRNSYITDIITQGAVVEEAWVENYTISFGHSGDIWRQYKESDSLKVFQANNDSTSTVTRQFMKQVLARFIRIYPVSWTAHVCMRVDIRSMGRSAPLGIQKQKIDDSAMTASSHAGSGNEPRRARLDLGFQSEAWRAGEDNGEQYLQIDLGTNHNITHVATQGSPRDERKLLGNKV